MDYQNRINQIDEEIAQLREVIALREEERRALEVLASVQKKSVNVVITHYSAPPTKPIEAAAQEKTVSVALHGFASLPSPQILDEAQEDSHSETPRKVEFVNFTSQLLMFIGDRKEVSYNDIFAFYPTIGRSQGSEKDASSRIRNDLYSLKNKYGYLQSPRMGYYSMSEKGREFLKKKKGESPAEAVATNDNGGALNVQPSPTTGAQ